jgi:hypothetical protein
MKATGRRWTMLWNTRAARRRFGLAYAGTLQCLLPMSRATGRVADAAAGCAWLTT